MSQCILVIDDQSDSLDRYSLLIRTFLPHVEVLTETDGSAGVKIAKDRRPQMILLDVKKPGMDGVEVCRRLKAEPLTADIPVLMVSGILAGAENRVEGFNVGAEGYLCKPFAPEELMVQITHLLRLKRQFDALQLCERNLEHERIRWAESLQEREMPYRNLIEALPLLILVVDEGRLVYGNPTAARLLGVDSPGELKGRRLSDFETQPPSVPSKAGGTTKFLHYETLWRKTNGEPVPVEVFRGAVAFDGKWMEQVIGLDITERKATMEHVLQIEERYRTLIEQLPAIIYILRLTPHPHFEYLSPQAESILGGRACEWLENYDHWVASIHPDDCERVLTFLTENGPWENRTLEYRIRGRDGREVWFRDHSRRLISSIHGEPIVHGVLVDITARKNAEAALHQKEEQLRQSQKMEALGRLAGGIAHDFNNLLTSIIGYAHMLMEEKTLDSEARCDLAEIIHAGERAERLTRQLLSFSRKQVVETAPINLNEVVEGMERLLRRTLGEDIELITLLSEEAGCIMAEATQLEQVLMNLAVNARSAMPRGGKLTISTERVELDEEFCRSRENLQPGDYVRLEVSDTGCGMPPEVRERVFEPFFTTKKPGEGTGIGLATVYGVVRGFGGIIEVESEVGRGTRFRMFFPRLDRRLEASRSTERAEVPGGHETILLVEDDVSVRRVAGRFLTGLGYNVLEASNSGEALLIFERPNTRVDLLLTDIVMPYVSGVEMAARLKKIQPELRVLYMTGFTQEASEMFQSEIGSDFVIFKPFTRITLARRVRQALDAPLAHEKKAGIL